MGACYRCSTTVYNAQWFVRMKPLARLSGLWRTAPQSVPVLRLPLDGECTTGVYRQLWWGHQIPAWYCDDCGHITVSREIPTECGPATAAISGVTRTCWIPGFQRPLFSTLGWPEKTEDLGCPLTCWSPATHYFLLGSAHDILRHGTYEGAPLPYCADTWAFRDSQGRKCPNAGAASTHGMINPLEPTPCFNLCTGNSPATTCAFMTERCEAMRLPTRFGTPAIRFNESDH